MDGLFSIYDDMPKISRVRLDMLKEEYRSGNLTPKMAVNHLLMFGIEYMYNCILIVFFIIAMVLGY